jgi:hypothetical protein
VRGVLPGVKRMVRDRERALGRLEDYVADEGLNVRLIRN